MVVGGVVLSHFFTMFSTNIKLRIQVVELRVVD